MAQLVHRCWTSALLPEKDSWIDTEWLISKVGGGVVGVRKIVLTHLIKLAWEAPCITNFVILDITFIILLCFTVDVCSHTRVL